MTPNETVSKASDRLAKELGMDPGALWPAWLWPLIEAAYRADDPTFVNTPEHVDNKHMGVVFVDPGCEAVLMSLSEVTDHSPHGLEVIDLYRNENGSYHYTVHNFEGEHI